MSCAQENDKILQADVSLKSHDEGIYLFWAPPLHMTSFQLDKRMLERMESAKRNREIAAYIIAVGLRWRIAVCRAGTKEDLNTL